MKAFLCGVLVPGCEAGFEAETEPELLAQIAAHARDEHGMHEVPPEVLDAIRATITES